MSGTVHLSPGEESFCMRFCSISQFYWDWVRAPVLRTTAGKLLISTTVNIIIVSGCLQEQLFRFKCCSCGFQTLLSIKPCLILMLRQKNDVTTQFHICLWHWLKTPYHWYSRRDERVTQRLNRILSKWKLKGWKFECPAVQERAESGLTMCRPAKKTKTHWSHGHSESCKFGQKLVLQSSQAVDANPPR